MVLRRWFWWPSNGTPVGIVVLSLIAISLLGWLGAPRFAGFEDFRRFIVGWQAGIPWLVAMALALAVINACLFFQLACNDYLLLSVAARPMLCSFLVLTTAYTAAGFTNPVPTLQQGQTAVASPVAGYAAWLKAFIIGNGAFATVLVMSHILKAAPPDPQDIRRAQHALRPVLRRMFSDPPRPPDEIAAKKLCESLKFIAEKAASLGGRLSLEEDLRYAAALSKHAAYLGQVLSRTPLPALGRLKYSSDSALRASTDFLLGRRTC